MRLKQTEHDQAADEERNRRIIELYLRAVNTQEAIAEAVGITQKAVSNIIEGFSKNATCREITKKWNLPASDKDHDSTQPYLYNIWNQKDQDNAVKHFGAFPEVYMENLLYYYTEPFIF